MAPNILNQSLKTEDKISNKKKLNIKKRILKFQNFIKRNFEYVGDEFAFKARSLHYDNKKS